MLTAVLTQGRVFLGARRIARAPSAAIAWSARSATHRSLLVSSFRPTHQNEWSRADSRTLAFLHDQYRFLQFHQDVLRANSHAIFL